MPFDILPYISATRQYWASALDSLKSWEKILSKTLLTLFKSHHIGCIVSTSFQVCSYFVTEKPRKTAHFHQISQFSSYLHSGNHFFCYKFVIVELQRWFWYIEQLLYPIGTPQTFVKTKLTFFCNPYLGQRHICI